VSGASCLGVGGGGGGVGRAVDGGGRRAACGRGKFPQKGAWSSSALPAVQIIFSCLLHKLFSADRSVPSASPQFRFGCAR